MQIQTIVFVKKALKTSTCSAICWRLKPLTNVFDSVFEAIKVKGKVELYDMVIAFS